MISERLIFLRHVAQTSENPYLLEVEKAEGMYLYAPDGKVYIDMISGIAVSNLGHRNPRVIQAVKDQLDKYMHLMVYGEFIQSPQIRLAEKLNSILPEKLNCTYFVNSGSEAIEGAIKLAKRFTGRHKVVAFKKAYHGSTLGALSVMGEESFKNAFRPLMPGVDFLEFNNLDELDRICNSVACVLIEPIQGEGGVILPEISFLSKLKKRCQDLGVLLIFDEIQTAFGRTGSMFAFEDFGVEPDVLVLAKGFGGGLPLGGFVSSGEIMSVFKTSPILGHITTFGGHPVCCAAGLANLEVLIEEDWIAEVAEKEQLFRKLLKNDSIIEIRGKGLLLAVELGDAGKVKDFIRRAKEKCIISDWFLFCDTAFRLCPPLIISSEEIRSVCARINEILDDI